jgi:histidinol dehydrogenase
VYPVYSRRSKGLSVGINLFPDQKLCSFDCPYCEVFPFKTDIRFSLSVMEGALRSALAEAAEREIPVRDICFSGNGEPAMSAHFREALEAAARIRDEAVPEAVLVLITNGTGLLDAGTFDFLRKAAVPRGASRDAPGGASRDTQRGTAADALGLQIWLKLDAGTPSWYEQMDRSRVPFAALIEKIREFARLAPVTIQTMICAVRGRVAPAEEEAAWVRLVAGLCNGVGSNAAGYNTANSSNGVSDGNNGAVESGYGAVGVQAVQIYGKARPAPEDPLAESLPASILENRAALLRGALKTPIPVEVFP